ncbi:ABC transporter permease [Caloranaerobacter sp. DY30410]|uniref:ABC transporter permease n=1 Tax=Caloranaerobacter sp. DY30410 TaxID=3238305 RepID=UPI003CFDFC2A
MRKCYSFSDSLKLPLVFFLFFFGNIFRLGERYIVRGELSKVLLRPINSLFQICIEEVYLGDAGAFFVGCTLVGVALFKMKISFTITRVIISLILLIVAVFIQLGFFLILTSLNFWFVGVQGFQILILRNINASRYPINIYHKIVQFIFTWVIPFAFIGYYPGLYVITGQLNHVMILSIILACILNLIGYRLWQAGSKRYNAPGW